MVLRLTRTPAPPLRPILGTVAGIAALWIASDIGYYALPPLFGMTASYNDHPVGASVYYAAWCVVALIVFRRWYHGWKPFTPWPGLYVALAAMAVTFTLYALLAPSLLPAVDWQETWPAPDILLAQPSYFLPKSVDILFQQLLIVALVLSLHSREHDLRRISVLCAMLFGVTHLLLLFGGLPPIYVVRFTIFATLFGFVFPWLILRVRNGLVWSYGLHWVYYAVTLVTAHLISPYMTP